MLHSSAGAHDLDLTGHQHSSVSHAVLVLEGSVKDVAEDLHVLMWMCWESRTWSDDILIDDPQRPEAHVGRVVVAGETEGVKTVQPPVAGMASGGGFAK